jgi:hypothetical protein
VIWSDFLSADGAKPLQEGSRARESRTVSGTFRKKSADIFTFFEKSAEIWKKTGGCQEDNMGSWAENAGGQEKTGDLSRRECGFVRQERGSGDKECAVLEKNGCLSRRESLFLS